MDNIVRREGGRSGAVTKDTDGSSYGEFSFHQSNVMDMLNATGYSKHFQGMQVNSPEFNKQFASLESPEFSKAQRDYWDKTYFQPAVKYSPSLVAKSPITAEVVADTYNQYGPKLGKKILDGAVAGRNLDELDPSEFIRLVQAYKRDNVKGHFNKYLTQNPNDEKGLLNRINDSETQWLAKAGTDQSVSDATGSLPYTAEDSDPVKELREKLNVERFLADSTVGRRLGIDPAVHQQFARPMDVNGSAYKPVDDSYGVLEGMYKGMRSSWAMIWADKMANKRIFFGKDMELSYDEIMDVAKEFGGNLDKAFAAMNYSDSPESLKKNIQLVKDHDELRRKMSNSAWYTQLLGGLAEAAFSPDTYIPFMASKTAGAVVMGAVGNALSTSFANSHLGTNDDIVESAVIGGVAGGVLFKGFGYLGKGAERLGRFSDQTTMRANLLAMGKEVPADFGGSQRLAVHLNNFRTKMEKIAPNNSMSVFNVIKNLPEGELKDLFVKALANEGAGYLRSSSGKAQRVVSELMTLDEMARNRTDAIYSIQDSYSLGWEQARIGGITKEDYSRAYVDAMEGKMDLVPERLKNNKDFMDSVKRTKEEFGSENYFPTMVSYNKMSDRVNELVKANNITQGEAQKIIKEEIRNDLLKSLGDDESYVKLYDWYQKNIEAARKEAYEAKVKAHKANLENQKKAKDKKQVKAVEEKYDSLEKQVDEKFSDLSEEDIKAYNKLTDTYQKKRAKAKTKEQAEKLDKEYKEALERFDPETLKRLKEHRKLKKAIKAKKDQAVNILKQDLSKVAIVDDNPIEPFVPSTAEDINKYFVKQASIDATGYVEGKNNLVMSVEQNKGTPTGVNSPVDFHETKVPWNHSLGTGINSVRNNSINPMMAVEERLNVEYGEKFLKSRGYVDKNGQASQAKLIAHLKKLRKDAYNNSKGEINFKDLDKALDLLPRMIFNNIGGRHDPDNLIGAIADILRNVAFMTKNSYMGLMNLFEQGEAIKAYGAWHIIKSIPAVNEMLTRWGSGNMTASEGKALTNYLYGKRVRQHELFSDIREMSIERQAARFKGNKALAAAVGWSEQMAFANPFTKFLKATEDNIVLSAQDSFTGELVSYAFTRQRKHKGKHYNTGFFTKETLDRNNVSEQEMENLLSALKDNVTFNSKDGSWTMNKEQANNLKSNAGAFATLRRLGDYVAQEVIQKNNLSDTNLWAGSANNPLINLLMQFKTFAMRSYNKRIVKSMQRAAEGDEFGQALTVMIGTALGTASAIAQTGLQTLGMTEEQREKFLEKVYGSTDWKNDSSIILAQGVLNGAMRSSIFASVGLVTGALGINPQIRSTNAVQYGTDGLGDWMVNNIPALSTLDVIRTGIMSGYAGATSDDDNLRDRKLRQFYNSLGRLTNIPFLSKAVPNWLNGEYR
jgi:hypothetical protein